MAARWPQETPIRTQSLFAVESAELSAFNDDNGGESTQMRPTVHPTWHPKVTLYRLLVLVATVGLGAAKAVTSYLNFNYASITLEWILGVVVFLFFHLLGSYEERDTQRLNWLFHVDYLEHLWSLLGIFDIHRPAYRSDESTEFRPIPRHPPITGYRILVTILVLFFGMLKSAFWYGNHQTEVTTIECVFGIGILTCLYWLGLYEDSSTKVYPLLFHVDYSSAVFYGLAVGSVIGQILLLLLALTACGGVTVIFYYLSTLTFNYPWSGSMFPQYPIVAFSTGVITNSLMVMMLVSGIVCALAILYVLLRMLVRCPFGRRMLSRRRVQNSISFVKSVYEEYWLPPASRQRRNRLFYLKRFLIRQCIKLPFNIILTIVFIFVVFLLFWLALMVAYVPSALLESYVPVTLTFPLLCFIFIPISFLLMSIFMRDFYRGFLDFLSDISNDYRDEGPSLPGS